METTSKISKAQTEVWEWKEKASAKLNKLSKEERIAYLKEKEAAFKNHLKKKTKKI